MNIPPQFPISSLALIFPDMTSQENDEMAESVLRLGLLDPMTVWRREIIDGRRRQAACDEAGVEHRYEFLADYADPRDFVVAKNIRRRQMSKSQAAAVAYEISQWSPPEQTEEQGEEKSANLRIFRRMTQEDAAALVGVSPRLVSYASNVLSADSPAVPQLRQAVKNGQASVYDASRVVNEPPDIQRRAVDLVVGGKAGTVTGAVKRIRRDDRHQAAPARLDQEPGTAGEGLTLHTAAVSDLRGLVAAGSVDAVITHPPHREDGLPLLAEVAAFAAHVLRPTGVLVVVGNFYLLPRMLEQLAHPDLRWLGELDMLYDGPPTRSGPPYRMDIHRQPILVYGKDDFHLRGGADLVRVPPPDALTPGLDREEQGMALLVARFAALGRTVCDPMMQQQAGTALGARETGCIFIGATDMQTSVELVRDRLSAAEDAGRS